MAGARSRCPASEDHSGVLDAGLWVIEKMNIQYRRNQDILVTEMDGDFVMMNVDTGEYHSIRGSGVRIWELAESPVTERQIVETICAECDISEDVCTADIRRFLAELLGAGLLLSS